MIDKLMGYLPDYYRKSALTRQIQQGAANELIGAETLLDYISTALYVTTADEKSIARYERIVGLHPGTFSLEQRRRRVLARLRGYETSTVEAIERVASRFLGCPVTAVEVNGEYRFYLEFERTVDDRGDVAAMREAVEEIKPAHLGWGYRDALRLPLAERRIRAAGAIYDPVAVITLPLIERTYEGKLRAYTAINFTTVTVTTLPAIGGGG